MSRAIQRSLRIHLGLVVAAIALCLPAQSQAVDVFQVSPDITIAMGPQTVTDENIALDGVAVSLASLGTLPANANLSAFHVLPNGDRLLSFDIAVNAGGVFAADEDLLRLSSGVFSLFFDGSAAGVANAMDLDAVHYLAASNQFLLSFDTSGQVGSIFFDDDDVLFYNPNDSSWSSAYRGASRHAGFESADLNALYIAQYTSELFKNGFESIP
jgi:hypothetical protein